MNLNLFNQNSIFVNFFEKCNNGFKYCVFPSQSLCWLWHRIQCKFNASLDQYSKLTLRLDAGGGKNWVECKKFEKMMILVNFLDFFYWKIRFMKTVTRTKRELCVTGCAVALLYWGPKIYYGVTWFEPIEKDWARWKGRVKVWKNWGKI